MYSNPFTKNIQIDSKHLIGQVQRCGFSIIVYKHISHPINYDIFFILPTYQNAKQIETLCKNAKPFLSLAPCRNALCRNHEATWNAAPSSCSRSLKRRKRNTFLSLFVVAVVNVLLLFSISLLDCSCSSVGRPSCFCSWIFNSSTLGLAVSNL